MSQEGERCKDGKQVGNTPMVTLSESLNPFLLDRLASELQAQQIPFIIGGKGALAWSRSGASESIQVPESRLAQAKQIMATLDSGDLEIPQEVPPQEIETQSNRHLIQRSSPKMISKARPDRGGLPDIQPTAGKDDLSNMPTNKAEQFDHRTLITAHVTSLLAAEVIARADFPSKSFLPKVKPFPFTTFGHQPFLDYPQLLTIVWSVIEEIQEDIRRNSNSKKQWGCGLIITGALAAFISVEGMLILMSITLFVSGIVLLYLGRNQILKNISAIRARAIENLMAGQWAGRPSVRMSSLIERYSGCSGDGVVDGTEAPVVIVESDNQPFPGFGILQMQNFYLCPPKLAEPLESPKLAEIQEHLRASVEKAIHQAGLAHVTFGDVVALYGSSIPMDSPWLGEDMAPKLWIDRTILNNVENIDPRCAARKYFAIEVLFPATLTVAYFFLRPFLAGRAASVHVALTTLGGPAYGPLYFRRRLIRHKVEQDEQEGRISTPMKGSSTTRPDKWEDDLENARLARLISKDETKFQQALDLDQLKKMQVNDINEEAETTRASLYNNEIDNIVKESVYWPGSLFRSQNWREENSLTFATGFFGRPEAVATVRAIFEELSRALLDGLEDLGFDASSYRDKEGKYSIDVDKIDQLIVGERITVAQRTKEKDESGKAKESTGGTAPA